MAGAHYVRFHMFLASNSLYRYSAIQKLNFWDSSISSIQLREMNTVLPRGISFSGHSGEFCERMFGARTRSVLLDPDGRGEEDFFRCLKAVRGLLRGDFIAIPKLHL